MAGGVFSQHCGLQCSCLRHREVQQATGLMVPLDISRVMNTSAFISFGHFPFFMAQYIVCGDWKQYNSNDSYLAPNLRGPFSCACLRPLDLSRHATTDRLVVAHYQGSYDPRTNISTLPDPAVLYPESIRLYECGPGGHDPLLLHPHLQRVCRRLARHSSLISNGFSFILCRS